MHPLKRIEPSQSLYHSMLCFVLPFAAITQRLFAIATFGLAVLGGYLWFKNRDENIAGRKIFLILLYTSIGFLAVFLLERYLRNHTLEYKNFRATEFYARFVILSPLFVLAMYAKTNIKWLLNGIAGALFCMCLYSIYQMQVLKAARSFGTYSYENLYACVLFSYCLVLSIYYKYTNILVVLIGVVAGVSGIIMTSTRGVWVLLPVLFFYIIYLGYRHIKAENTTPHSDKKTTWLVKALYLMFATALLFSLLWISSAKLQERYLQTMHELPLIEAKKWSDSSIGTRVELWGIGIKLANQNPLLGGGWGSFKEHLIQLAESNKAPKNYAEFQGPHNLIILVLGEHGYFIGLAFLGFVFAFPIFSKYGYGKQMRNNNRALLIFFVITFAVMSMSESILERQAGMNWFSFFWLTSFGLAVRQNKNTEL